MKINLILALLLSIYVSCTTLPPKRNEVRIHIQARSNLLNGAFAWTLTEFYAATKQPFYKTLFLDTLIKDKSLKQKLVNGIQFLEEDTLLYDCINIKVLCRVQYNKKEYLLIAFNPYRSIYIKDMKKGMFFENDGQMYKWNEDFYENIRCYVPYKYP